MKPTADLQGLLQGHIDHLYQLTRNSWRARTLFAIARCRTAQMGGHIDKCNHRSCGKLHISYNSCRNRHCPQCQGHLQQRWIDAREQDLLNTSYFHVVFTLPAALNQLALHQPLLVYGLLFREAWKVIQDFAREPKFLGAQTGMTALLHTWGQNLSLHPHLHCIVPGGGVSKSGKWKSTRSKGKYLFPVKAMSRVFRARLVAALRKQHLLSPAVSKMLFAKPWVVYCKQPFNGPRQVIAYLGRYTHKIAISNQRIQQITDGKVSFTAKDYQKGGKKVTLSLDQGEFIRRFSMHILPKGFTRIRHYGILSSTSKGTIKQLVDAQLGALIILQGNRKKTMLNVCPICRKGRLETIAVFGQRGPPTSWLEVLK